MTIVTCLLLLAATACVAAFTVAVMVHFRIDSGPRIGMRVVAVATALGYVIFTASVLILGQGGAWPLAIVLFGLSGALFAASVAATRDSRLTLAYTEDTPAFLLSQGPYGLVRHPFYASYLLFWLGTALAQSTVVYWIVPAFMAGLYVDAARREERKFRNSPFAHHYAQYCKKVGMIWPRFGLLVAAPRSSAGPADAASRQSTRGKLAGRVRDLRVGLTYFVTHRLRLQAATTDPAALQQEQARTLATTSWLFAVLGISSAALISRDFGIGLLSVNAAIIGLIIGLYGLWLFFAARFQRRTDDGGFLRISVVILFVQGVLWGTLAVVLAGLAGDQQRLTLTAGIMALLSTPMLGAPFAAAMAFWLPVVIGASWAILIRLQPADHYLQLFFGGYACFTLAGIVVLNRTLLDRSIARIELQLKRETIQLFLREYEDNASDWSWEIGRDGVLREINVRMARAAGMTRDALGAMTLVALLSATEDERALNRELLDLIESQTAFRNITAQLFVRGERRWWSMTGHPVMDKRAQFRGFRGIGSDVTEIRRSEAHIQRLATQDSLTGLFNRQVFLDRLEAECRTHEGGASEFAVLLIDLDRFKEVNDSHGHGVGDELLIIVADRLRAATRLGDLVARLGGDEFAILLPAATALDAEDVATRLQLLLSQPVTVDGIEFSPAACVGIALAPVDGAETSVLVRNADLALYAAKQRRAGGFMMFQAGLWHAHEHRLSWKSELQQALEADAIEVVRLPIVDLAASVRVGWRVSAAWHHPRRGSLSLSAIVTLADETGLADRLHLSLLRRACHEAAPGPEHIAFPISPSCRASPHVIMEIVECVRTSGLPPRCLTLIVDNSFLVGVSEQARSALRDLQALGVKFLLNDPGRVCDVLAAWPGVQLSGMVIDASVVVRPGHETDRFIKAVMAFAAELSLVVIASGVTDSRQCERLQACGVTQAWGPLLDCAPADRARLLPV